MPTIEASLTLGDLLMGADIVCFPYHTMITTREGLIPIGDIVEQELDVEVLVLNPHDLQPLWSPIDAYFKTPRQRPMLAIHTRNNRYVSCTDNHPIFVNGSGFIPARNIQSGMEVLEVDEGGRSVWQVVKEVLSSKDVDTVYNLGVRRYHVYVANGLLAHNCLPHN